MKSIYIIGLSMAAGVVVGASAIQGLHAQAKTPVYAITIIDEITDPAANAANSGRTNEAAAETSKGFGGHYLVRTHNITRLDGTPPKRVLIHEFDSIENAQKWYNSSDQQKVNEIRLKSTRSRAFIAEGLAQ
jgi:uncharacterized protein (DUF1330 family)